MQIDREHVRKQFDQYTASYDLSDTKIRLKAEHTYRVAELCARITGSLALPAEDVDLAWLLGMLHDIGRFEQVRRYGTFTDAKSVDHAAFGADLLFREGLIRNFVSSEEEDGLIETAIRLHNAYLLPEDLPERERMFSQILRDADKIDILRVNCEFSRQEIYNRPEEEFLTSEISEQVLQDALSMQNVLRAHRKTAADYIVSQISLTFGLVYDESRKIVLEQGYLDRILDFDSRNPETVRRLQQIRSKVKQFLNKAEVPVSVEEMRRRDAATIAAGTPGKVLMRRAAEGIFKAWSEWPDGTLILCGSGNNGGDGFALAEILSEQKISCRILTRSDRRTEDAAYYEQRAAAAGVPIQKYEAGSYIEAPLIVDCLLGTGFQGEVREPYASAIRNINSARECGSRVISADINSGMNGDDGSGALVVQSDLTVTIGLMKTGFFTEAGKTHYKELTLAEIGII